MQQVQLNDMKKPLIGFFGAGRLAEALIEGLLRKSWPADNIGVVSYSGNSAKILSDRLGVVFFEKTEMLAEKTDFWIIACKPGSFDELAEKIAPLAEEKTIVSVMAKTKITNLRNALPKARCVGRVMPSVAAQVGEGINGYVLENNWPQDQEALLMELLKAWGQDFLVTENDIDAFTAIAACGPAYVWEFANGLVEAARKMGMDEKKAVTLCKAVLEGAALTWEKTGKTPENLRNQVAPPGGGTQAALEYMEAHQWTKTLIEGALTAYKKFAD